MGSIFDFIDYKAYLSSWIEKRPNSGWGARSGMAQAIGCQTAYLSRILNADANLSLEQAETLSEFLQHTEDEAEYFLLLVGRERSGTPALKARFERKIQKMQNDQLDLKNRFKVKTNLSQKVSGLT